jgi:hypothetical protein
MPPEDKINFPRAHIAAMKGSGIRRQGWNGQGLTVKVQFPDKGSMNTVPYFYIKYPDDHKMYPGLRVPWVPSQTDMFADDWIILEVK